MAPRRIRVAVVGLCVAWLALRASTPRAANWFVYDDAFYYFAIARNVAHGLGSTFDGLHVTNGYHPLWLAACTVPYLLGLDDERAVQALLAAGTIGLGVAVLLGARVVERRAADNLDGEARGVLAGGVLLCAFAFSPLGVSIFANGLESSCTLVFAALLLERLDAHGDALFSPDRARSRLAIAALAAGAFLSRTDAIFLLPWLGAWALVRAPARRLRIVVELCALPALVVAVYLGLNWRLFGTATQVSGDLKRIVPSAGGLATMAALVLGPLAALWVLRRRRLELLPRTGVLLTRTAPVLLWAFSELAYYEGLQRWAQLWYFVVPCFYGAVVLAVALVDLVGSPRAARAPKGLAAAVLVLALALLGGSVVDAATPGAFTMLEKNVEAARWIRANVPEDAVLGSWDAGALGYYSHRRVLNLDGEVGDAAYLRALRSGRTAEWASSERIDYLVNHADLEHGEERFRSLAASYLGGARVARGSVVRSWPFIHRGATNGRPRGRHKMAVWLVKLEPPER